MEFMFGYLDAGSGALIVQLLVGGLAGIAAFVKFRWRSLRSGNSVSEATTSEATGPAE